MSGNKNDNKKDTPESHINTNKQVSLAKLYSSLRPALLNFAARYLKKGPEVEDVVQEAFVKVLEAQRDRKINTPQSYLYSTTKNLALNILNKSDYRLTDTLGDLLPDTVLLKTLPLESEFESSRKFELFCHAVRELPVKCRRVYVMRRVYGFSQKEIASELNISIKTVETHLTKAILHCSDYMNQIEKEQIDKSQEVSNIKKKGQCNG